MIELGKDSSGDRQVADDITATLRRAGDAVGKPGDGVLAMFADEPSTTLFDYLAPRLIGLDQLRETVDDLARNAVRAEVTYPRVTVQQLADDIALSLATSVIDIELRDGTSMRLNTRCTDVWRRFGDRWLAVHEHASVPIDLQTERAILDSPTT